MKVLYQDLAPKSGAQANNLAMLQAMAKDFPDDEYAVLCLESSWYRQLGNIPNVQIIPLRYGLLREWSRFWMETLQIGRIASECSADVICTCNLGPYCRTGIPQVLMVRNPFQVCPWADVGMHPRSRFVVAFLRLFFRRSLHCSDAVQVQTPLFEKIVRSIPGAPKQIAVIPKAVESSEDIEPQPLSEELEGLLDGGLGRSAFTFLYVATCLPHKNHTVVIAAIERLRLLGIKARVVFSVAREQLVRIYNPASAAQLIKEGYIVPLKWISKQHLRAVYDACDACVMPSKSEQLSSAHLEAMHWKKPQISADLPYSRDLCGDATLYADPDDPTEWVKYMQILMTDHERRNRLVAAGTERAKCLPKNWKEVAWQFRAFLADVAKRRGGRVGGAGRDSGP